VAHPTGPGAVVVFDVDETLSDLAPLARRFADLGAPPRPAHLRPPDRTAASVGGLVEVLGR
jgi:phosphoglycolate phosphatase-like HAD superfamily hydrolase